MRLVSYNVCTAACMTIMCTICYGWYCTYMLIYHAVPHFFYSLHGYLHNNHTKQHQLSLEIVMHRV